jgi:hypothetical protein
MKLAWLAAALLPGCLFVDHSPSGACPTASTLPIDTGATISHTAGVDAGYYAAYTAGGLWHLEWTCDTKLSAQGCNFTGSVVVDTPPGGAAATCVACEANDLMTVHDLGATTQVDFDTLTASGLDGVDVRGLPGHPLRLDLQIDGLYQNDLVFVPSAGQPVTPSCMPLTLTPTAP